MKRVWLRCRSVLALIGTICAVTASAPVVPRADRAPEFRLAGDQVILPIVMVREYPFVDGEVAGIRGRLLFDTGIDEALALNAHRIRLAGGREIGTGHFGSGQSFSIRLNPTVTDVRAGPLHYPHVTEVASQDATQLEHITPDFLGWLGYDLWKGYALELDYVRSRAMFHKEPASAYLAGQKVIGVISFETRKLPNDPIIHVRIGDIDAVGVFDTGQYGLLYIDETTKTHLLATGALRASATAGSFDLAGIEIGGQHLPGVSGMDVETTPFPPAEPMGVKERIVMTLGYGFLHQYRTIWDYRTKRIYLLPR